MRKLILLLLSIFLLSSAASPQRRVTDEEYRIYAVVLRKIEKKYREEERSGGREFVFVRETALPDDFDISNYKTLKRFPGLLRSFSERNSTSASLEPRFALTDYKIIGKNEVESIYKEAKEADKQAREARPEFYENVEVVGNVGAAAFYQKYPDAAGLYTLSRVGFSKDRSRALVVVDEDNGCSGLQGIYLLTMTRRNWKSTFIGGMSWIC